VTVLDSIIDASAPTWPRARRNPIRGHQGTLAGGRGATDVMGALNAPASVVHRRGEAAARRARVAPVLDPAELAREYQAAGAR